MIGQCRSRANTCSLRGWYQTVPQTQQQKNRSRVSATGDTKGYRKHNWRTGALFLLQVIPKCTANTTSEEQEPCFCYRWYQSVPQTQQQKNRSPISATGYTKVYRKHNSWRTGALFLLQVIPKCTANTTAEEQEPYFCYRWYQSVPQTQQLKNRSPISATGTTKVYRKHNSRRTGALFLLQVIPKCTTNTTAE
jgi:predicted phosphoadenosine phosphosulfate sulfurtransferase